MKAARRHYRIGISRSANADRNGDQYGIGLDCHGGDR
jgi:hypothetical protein